MNNYADSGECYPPKPKVDADKPLRGWSFFQRCVKFSATFYQNYWTNLSSSQGFSAAVPFSGDSLYHWCHVITEFCKRLLNLVDAGWLWRISKRISANKRRRNILNFLNTNLTKSAAIRLKKGQSLKITHAKKTERRKRKSEEEERRRREKKQWLHS